MTDSLRIVFMGTPDFAVPALEALLAHHEEVVAVVSQPDRPRGRGRKLAATPVKTAAAQAALTVLQPARIKTDLVRQLAVFNPDLIIVAAYGRILPDAVLTLPRFGCLNIHASLLPKYRGAAPIQWAILDGAQETGVTIMQIDSGLDTGDILLTGRLTIDSQDTAATLFAKMAKLGGKLIIQALDELRAGNLTPQRQDDRLVSLAPPLSKDASPIDWHRAADKISCQIRGLDPWPLAHTTLAGKKLRLFKPTALKKSGEAVPGTILAADKNGLLIACADGSLLVEEIQLAGSKRMPVAAFILGRPLKAGQILGA
ncbi:MAG: methionyl-tRNA formyltransferase [Deltaproteobacteria bacterium]|nr:methionyl-tRNA formyltransferase [Deltaproteobacteria bacterium]